MFFYVRRNAWKFSYPIGKAKIMTVYKSRKPGHCRSSHWEVFLEIWWYKESWLRILAKPLKNGCDRNISGWLLPSLRYNVSSITGYSCYEKCVFYKCEYQWRVQEPYYIWHRIPYDNGKRLSDIIYCCKNLHLGCDQNFASKCNIAIAYSILEFLETRKVK